MDANGQDDGLLVLVVLVVFLKRIQLEKMQAVSSTKWLNEETLIGETDVVNETEYV